MKLIVEVEMPKIPQNCGECKFHKPLYHTQYCVLERKNCAPWKTRKDWCPIKGVLPNEHGDLVDRDVSIQTFKCIEEAPYSGFDGQEAFYTPEDVVNTLLCQDVVITAERKDNDNLSVEPVL